MVVILLTTDLTVVSRVEGAAARQGMSVRVAANESAAVERAAAEHATLLVVDLSAPLKDTKTLVEHCKALPSPPQIVAFGPHVHQERLTMARDAGCDEVVSRGQFFSQLDAILARAVSQD
jgi:DNA-binding response OmpR family regulator